MKRLYPILSKHAYDSKMVPMPYKSIKGLENIDKVIEIDQIAHRPHPAEQPGYLLRFLYRYPPVVFRRCLKPRSGVTTPAVSPST